MIILGGGFTVILLEGFGVEIGQTFDVMLADSISGEFDTISQPLFMD